MEKTDNFEGEKGDRLVVGTEDSFDFVFLR